MRSGPLGVLLAAAACIRSPGEPPPGITKPHGRTSDATHARAKRPTHCPSRQAGPNPLDADLPVAIPSRSDTPTFCLNPASNFPRTGYETIALWATFAKRYPIHLLRPCGFNSPFCRRGLGGKFFCLGPLNPKRAYSGWVGGILAVRSAYV